MVIDFRDYTQLPDFKNVDIVTHAIHSRLQLVRSRVYYDPEWSRTTGYLNFLNANWTLMKAIEKSIKITHQVNVSYDPHWKDAAKMFIYAFHHSYI